MRYILAIDGGATKLSCVLAGASGRFVGHGQGGPTNSTFSTRQEITNSIKEAVTRACSSLPAGISPTLGVYSAAPVRPEIMRECIREAFPGNDLELHIFPEFKVSLMAAMQLEHGCVVQSGTGSFAWLSVPADPEEGGYAFTGLPGQHRIGGWGSLFGDEGSGFWIGQQVLVHFFKMVDTRLPKTALYPAIMEHFEAQDVRSVINQVYQRDGAQQRKVVASLCPLAGRLADQGEPHCTSILKRAAGHLADQAKAALVRAQVQGQVPVSIEGGAWKTSPVMFTHFARLLSSCPQVDLRKPLFEPVMGGILTGLKDQGLDLPGHLAQLQREFPQFLFPRQCLEL